MPGGLGGAGPVGQRQGLAIHLSVGRERERVQGHERGGQHVLGQCAAELSTQRGPVGDRGSGARGRQVGDDPALAGLVLANDDHGLADLGQRGQRRLDLAELDPKAAHLHLVVDATEIFEHSVGPPTCQVTGAVQACARLLREGVGNEPIRRQLGTTAVRASQLDAAEVQFAGHADRDRRHQLIEHVYLGVGDRCADGHARPGPSRPTRPARHVHGCLGRSVEVLQGGAWQFTMQARGEFGGQCLAAAHDQPQRRALLGLRIAEEGVQHRRHEVADRDALALDQPGQVGRVPVAAGIGQHQAGSGHQRPEQFPDRDVEADRRLLQDRVRLAEAVSVLHPQQAVDDPSVRYLHTLGTASGARGVDHVGEVVGSGRGLGSRVEPAVRQRRVDLGRHFDHVHALVRELIGLGARIREQHRDARVGQHEREPVRGIAGVERQVGATGLEHGEQRHHQLDRALHVHAHDHVRADAELAQPPGEPVGPAVQLGVVEFPVPAAHCDAFGGRLILEQGGECPLQRPGYGRVVPVPHHLPTLVGAEQIHRRHACGRLRADGREDRAQGLGEPGRRGCVEEVCVVVQPADDLRPGVQHPQVQIELAVGLGDLDQLELRPGAANSPIRMFCSAKSTWTSGLRERSRSRTSEPTK